MHCKNDKERQIQTPVVPTRDDEKTCLSARVPRKRVMCFTFFAQKASSPISPLNFFGSFAEKLESSRRSRRSMFFSIKKFPSTRKISCDAWGRFSWPIRWIAKDCVLFNLSGIRQTTILVRTWDGRCDVKLYHQDSPFCSLFPQYKSDIRRKSEVQKRFLTAIFVIQHSIH